ncbi:MAG: hypothetical protein HW416_2595 [Chloroflexi bacterium]|nr:hypothetical protein [Chloroflexota bacterium]
MERRRLVADRFRRVWSIAEFIAEQPGLTRFELAQRFALSERQLQADLNLIRDEIGLPLTRDHGYRFAHNGNAPLALNLRDLHTLFLLIQRASSDPDTSPVALAAVVEKLPHAFPPPLQPLVRKTLGPPATDGFGPGPDVFAVLADAVARCQTVKLSYPMHSNVGYLTEPIVDPHMLLPYGESWYLIGRCHQRKRVVMLCIDMLNNATTEL